MSDVSQLASLRERLVDWTDYDVAAYSIAVALAVAPTSTEGWASWSGKKWTFWSANPLGEVFYVMLKMLSANGVLEDDAEAQKVRWNRSFVWEAYQSPKPISNDPRDPTA